jgi:predicted nucleic acid-binding protein
MIVLDTSVLVDGLAGTKWLNAALRAALDRGERLLVPSLVLYEWLRGPRLPEELAAQEALFPRELTLPFGPHEAALAAEIYKSVRRPRGRELDLAVAAHAIARDAELWTLNAKDFRDIPALRLAAMP